MARDIEEFLRRAAERRKQQAGGQQPPPPRQQPRPAQRQPTPQPQQPARRLIIEDDAVYDQPEIVDPIPRKPRSVISDHVEQYVDSSDIADHATHLGERLQQTDEKVEARLQRTFGRDISRLDDRPSVQDPNAEIVVGVESGDMAKDLLALFRSPQTMRQAILVSEIMKRRNWD